MKAEPWMLEAWRRLRDGSMEDARRASNRAKHRKVVTEYVRAARRLNHLIVLALQEGRAE